MYSAGEQQFLDRRPQCRRFNKIPALRSLPEFAQKAQIKVLHIARADLQDVRISFEQRNLAGIHHFADHQQTATPVRGICAIVSGFCFAQALKAVQARIVV